MIHGLIQLLGEKFGLVAHCFISSLEVKNDDSVDQAWGELALQRFSELESSEVIGVSWNEIKSKIKQ